MDKYDIPENRIKIPDWNDKNNRFRGYPDYAFLKSREPILAKSPTSSVRDMAPFYPIQGALGNF